MAPAQMSSSLLRQYAVLDNESNKLLKIAMEKLHLSARAYDKILKVARTIADMEESEHIKSKHIAEAINYRNLDREGWGKLKKGRIISPFFNLFIRN